MARRDHGRFVEHVKLRTSGHFYRIQAPLDASTARATFKLIEARRAIEPVPGGYYFRGTKRSRQRVALCVFEIRRPPAFAPTCKELRETRYGFCCLVESKQVLFVNHAGFSWADALLEAADAEPLTPDESHAVLGSIKQPRIDKISTRSMSVAAKAIYERTMEGDDLEAALPSLGANRHVLRAIRAVDGMSGSTLNLVPGSSRLTQLGPRVDFDSTLSWAGGTMLRKINSGRTFPFLGRFAQAIRFDELPTSVEPKGLSLALALPTFAGVDWELESKTGTVRSGPPQVMQSLFDRLRLKLGLPSEVSSRNGKLVARFPMPVGDVVVRENKKSYSIENPFLRRVRFLDPETQTPRTLLSALNESRAFLITFSDIEYAYVNAQLVKSTHVRQSLGELLRIVEAHQGLRKANSEKGQLRGAIDPLSLFGAIEQLCSKRDDVLLLDDGSTEWTDYIGLSLQPQGPILTFYHAKYTGRSSTSASVLQEVIGQAEKNLGWLVASPTELEKRERHYWSQPYKWPAGGKLQRIRRNKTGKPLVDVLTDAASHPKTIRRACIVVSSLSKGILRSLARSKGKRLAPNESQLAWLLATFVSTCREAGVQPVIMCPP